jgi:hypothetical protein
MTAVLLVILGLTVGLPAFVLGYGLWITRGVTGPRVSP